VKQFQRSIISPSSKWDIGYAVTYNPNLPDKGLSLDLPNFTTQENHGRHIFMAPLNKGGANCALCHVPPTFALDAESRSNGLDLGEQRFFKAPSLKNAALSGAFMHDGRFTTLQQVVTHYVDGIQIGAALDNRLQAVPMNTADQEALVAFLKTLTDDQLLSDPKFSNPFKP
jgi:cytochrome c peroxidase